MTFELGVNYWPKRRAMYMWREFDLSEIRDDFAHIANIGFDVVRIFALTQDFLPAPLTVSSQMVGRLLDVVIAARDAGLRIMPTLVVLNMSGKIWWPEWMLGGDGTPRDLFTDPVLLRSQAMLVEECARELAGEPCVRAFDISNEIDDAQRPKSRDAGWLWSSLLANTVRRASPGVPIQIGAHLPSLSTQNNMRIDDLAEIADEDVMHAYPLYSEVARSFLDPELVPFSCALTTALSGTERRTLMQEFGLCTAAEGVAGHTIIDDFLGAQRSQYLASEEEGATYYDAVMTRLIATGAAGAYAWSYGDYDASLFEREPFARAVRERSFGLVRADDSEKPAVDVFRKLRTQRDAGALDVQLVPPTLDVTVDEYYASPETHFARLYRRWLEREQQ